MSNQKLQKSSVEFSKTENIDQKIMEETAMIKGIIEYVREEKFFGFYSNYKKKCFGFYSEYKRLGGQLPKPSFKMLLNKFFDLTLNLYNQNNSLNLDVYSLWKDYIEDDLSNPPSYEKIEMDVEEFWQIIDNVKDSETPQKDIGINLDKLPIGKLISYQEHLFDFHDKANRWDIWGAAYIANGGCSEGNFMDFRSWLISRGKDVYEAALENPDNLVVLDFKYSFYYKSFAFVAIEIYEEKMDTDLPDSGLESVSIFGERWDFDNVYENIKRLPRLWEKYRNFKRPIVDFFEVA